MAKGLDGKNLGHVLTHLNDILGLNGVEQPLELVVCGGSSLVATGLIMRSTRDVDVMAFVRDDDDGGRSVEPSKPFPPILRSAAERVAADLQMDANWLNSDTSSIVKDGMPEGFLERLHTVDYGSSLKVHYISRFDQIHLKLYAASFPDDRHLQDLIALRPSRKELAAAEVWTVSHWSEDHPRRRICESIVGELSDELDAEDV